MNLFDALGDETLQIRDPGGRVVWEGKAEGGRISGAPSVAPAIVWDLTKTDGTVLYHFRGQDALLVRDGETFTIPGDLTLSRF